MGKGKTIFWLLAAAALVFMLNEKNQFISVKKKSNGKGKTNVVTPDEKRRKEKNAVVGKIESLVMMKRVLRRSGVVVISFSARWCDPCQRSKPTFKYLSSEYEDRANFFAVDVDKSMILQRRHSINELPTFIVFFDGDEKGRHCLLYTSDAADE